MKIRQVKAPGKGTGKNSAQKAESTVPPRQRPCESGSLRMRHRSGLSAYFYFVTDRNTDGISGGNTIGRTFARSFRA